MTLVPMFVFGLLEIGLRIGGYGYSTRFFLDGSRLEKTGSKIDNRDFGRWVFPRGLDQTPAPVAFAINHDKPADIVRVFVRGSRETFPFLSRSAFPRLQRVCG